MKLSPGSHRKLEMFFREYLQTEDFKLPPIYFYFGNFTHAMTRLIKVNGITFGRRIFILPELISLNASRRRRIPEDLAAHEIMHVIQYRRNGFIKFLYVYLRDYWRNLRRREKWDSASRRLAYLEIPFEIEARDAAQKFLEWKEKLDV